MSGLITHGSEHPQTDPIALSVEKLRIAYRSARKTLEVVHDISFDLAAGKCLGLVGESGCGKSTVALSLVDLLPGNAEVSAESIRINGDEIQKLSAKEKRRIRGNDVGFIFQDPMSSLNPYLRIGYQLCEQLHQHQCLTKYAAKERAISLLEEVGIPDAKNRLSAYPHEFSGGQRQRIMISMAISCQPKLLIADEPTTALDVTIQAQVLDLLKQLQHDYGMSVLLITHDFGVVAGMCDEVCVMNDGHIVERQVTEQIFTDPQEDYTKKLLSAVPRLPQWNNKSDAQVAEGSA